MKYKTAILLNDTSYTNHHGCRLVVNNLREALHAHNIIITDSCPVGQDWNKLKDSIELCDMVIINGEGTIHDGCAEGLNLLQSVHCKKPVVLLNALYENNPEEWRVYLGKMHTIGLRDHLSFACVSALGLKQVFFTSDLSLFSITARNYTQQRQGIAIGDSIYPHITQDLYTFYKKRKTDSLYYMPIRTSRKHIKGKSFDNLRFYGKTFFRKLCDKHYCLYKNEEDFLSDLARKSLYITGRFHGVCMALKTQTPFLCITSNTQKIQALLQEVGLENRLITHIDESLLDKNWEYSEEENNRISAFIPTANKQWQKILEHIAK